MWTVNRERIIGKEMVQKRVRVLNDMGPNVQEKQRSESEWERIKESDASRFRHYMVSLFKVKNYVLWNVDEAFEVSKNVTFTHFVA